MPLSNNLVYSSNQDEVKRFYQPQFPLKYDPTHGPYKPITTELGSIQQNFQNLLLTNPGEWPMKPQLGIGLKRYLFENYDSPELLKLKPRIIRQLDQYLPELNLLDVNINESEENQDQGLLEITFRYTIYRASFFELIARIENIRKLTNVMLIVNKFQPEQELLLESAKYLTSGIRVVN